jgi:hypothetical protein
MSTGGNKRNARTTHPRKSARRVRALSRISPMRHDGASNERIIRATCARIGKPPRAWPDSRAMKKMHLEAEAA